MDEQLELPQASVMRIVKSALPEGVIVSKDAKLAFAKAARVFIQYVIACANDYSSTLSRQTISPNHVFEALKEVEFNDFADRLTKYLEDHKAAVASKKNKKKAGKEEDGENDDEEAKDDELDVDA